MKSQIREVHTCDYCNKKLFIRSAMERHESICSKNPENFTACSGCIYLFREDCSFEDDRYANEYYRSESYKYKGFYCKKLSKALYPPKCKTLASRYPDTFEDQELMPKECEQMRFVNDDL